MPNWITMPEPFDPNKSAEQNRYRHRGTLLCACGKPCTIDPDDTDAADCAFCGRLYNSSGQSLVPRDQWEEPIDAD